MNKRIAKVLTALLLCMVFVSQSVVMTQAVTFQNTYNNNFSDVSKDSWYYGSVAEAYSLGIINGVSATSFSPDGTLTLAECIKIASCVHQLINTGSVTLTNGSPNWYDSYVSYALQNNIITETYDNYSQYASRATVAVLFARVLPAETEWVNYLEGDNFPLKDVKDNKSWYFTSVYKLYLCGIMTGDTNGNFNPTASVKRSEIAAVICRMVDSSVRVKVNDDGTTSLVGGESSIIGSGDTISVDVKPWSMMIYPGQTAKVASTGATGFTFIFNSNGITGYNVSCLNDVKLLNNGVSFTFKKDVGLEAMGIIRGWLNQAVNGEKTLSEFCSVYVNGRQPTVTGITVDETTGDSVYTVRFKENYDDTKISSVAMICGTVPENEMQTVTTLVQSESKTPDAIISGGSTTNNTSSSNNNAAYNQTIANIKADGFVVDFEYKADKCTVIYGHKNDSYSLTLVYPDGQKMELSSVKLTNIYVNQQGTVLYYSIPAPNGSSVETGVNIASDGGTTNNNNNSNSNGSTEINNNASDNKNESETPDKQDLTGDISGLKVRISAQDASTIALLAGEGDVVFYGAFPSRATAFSVIGVTNDKYYEFYAKYISNGDKDNRIFAKSGGYYFALVFPDGVEHYVKEAAERVIANLITDNTFDCVFTSMSDNAPSFANGMQYAYVSNVTSTSVICDPFTLKNESQGPNSSNIANYMVANETHSVSSNCEIWILANDWTPALRTDIKGFANIWSSVSSQKIWILEMDSNGTITKIIQPYIEG